MQVLIRIVQLFVMVQRWRISSNSQPPVIVADIHQSCLWWFKDEEFQAIHNSIVMTSTNCGVVCDGSKMKNFKQFTTVLLPKYVIHRLFVMVQRWRISSNSQQPTNGAAWWAGCLWWFKDEEFQAIHNNPNVAMSGSSVVCDGSKMKNFKQFTTKYRY